MLIVVGHRGAAGLEPENTLRGFRRAIELGVDCVECDVHLTRDDRLAVIHDTTVDRTTNGHGPVSSFTLAKLKDLDAGQGERIPALEEVLETIRGRVRLLLEMKGEGTAEPAVQAVLQAGLEESVTFTCFVLDRLREVRQLNPNLSTGAIFAPPPADVIAQAVDAGASSLGVHYPHVTRPLVEEAHAAGLFIRAWNPDTVEEMRAMMALGVDGISTNRPDLLLGLVRGGE
jgi:glycerophosphoryl diester phosphodiesterase